MSAYLYAWTFHSRLPFGYTLSHFVAYLSPLFTSLVLLWTYAEVLAFEVQKAMLGMEHPRKYRGANRANLGAENPDSQDTSTYMLVSSHSSVLNLLNSSAYRFAPNQSPTLLCDNQGMISLEKNPTHYAKTKHLDVQPHFIRDHVEKGKINVQYCPT